VKRLTRPLAIALVAFLALAFVAGVATTIVWPRYVAGLGPIDLEASREGSTVVVDRDGRLLRPFTLPDGRWRLPATTHDVDPRYIAMLVAYEDGRFYEHRGVDARALLRAAGQWLWRGRVVSGGSTLSMQVARLIEPRPERSLKAKLSQIARALQIEREVGKAGVLDRYLTLAPFGGNLEGVRAASLAYFGKEPLKLTIAEAALLVALPQSPEARRPDRFSEAARAARDRVLERVAARGIISADDAEAARRESVPTARKAFPNSPPTRRKRRSPPTKSRRSFASPSTRACKRSLKRSPRKVLRGSAPNCPPRSWSSIIGPAKFALASAPPTSRTRRATAPSTCRARRARRARR
jgi:penicillin-binding protein 1C